MYKLNEIVVTGNRLHNEIRKLSASVQIIDSVELHDINGSSLADVVKFQHGIFLSSYGGAGALQTISLRGLASDYSLLLIDGQRFTTFQIGTVDLGIFSLTDIERIEIVAGGNSALYGADAVGGVINVITKPPVNAKEISITAATGSFGFQSYGMEIAQSFYEISFRASAALERAKNDFPFTYSDGVQTLSLKREGADYVLKNINLAAASTFSENIFSRLSLRLSEADRGQPSAVTSSVQNNRARILDKNVFLSFKTEWSINQENLFALAASFQYKFQNYFDPALLIGNKKLDAVYYNRIFSLSPSWQVLCTEENKILFGIDVVRGTLKSSEVHSSRRDQFSAYLSSQIALNNVVDVLLYPALRYDSYSDVQGDVSPKIGINVGLPSFENIRLRASYGKNYRIPTFNDLYWIQGGNPNLHPERSLSGDVGVLGTFSFIGKLETEVTYFSIKTKDKIVWRPVSGTVWSPFNISVVSSTGMEASIRSSFFNDGLVGQWNYTLTNSIKESADVPNDVTQGKRMPFLPKEIMHVSLSGKYLNFSASVMYSFNSFRFTQADNNPQKYLPAYSTLDGNISFRFTAFNVLSNVKLEANNITNEEYSLITNYPVPLRNFRITFQTTI